MPIRNDPVFGTTEEKDDAPTQATPPQTGIVSDPVFGTGLEEIPLPFDPNRREFTGREDTLREAFSPANIGQNLRANLVRTFTLDPQRRAQAFQEIFPGAEINEDTQGNLLVKIPGREPEFVNRPGFDVQDALGVTGQALSFVPAGRAAALGSTLGRRGVIGAGTAAGTDVAMQGVVEALGGGEVDPLQTGIVGATGGVAELAAPVIAPIARALRPTPGAAQAAGELGREGIEAAADVGTRAVLEGAEVAAPAAAREAAQGGVVALEREFLPNSLSRGERTLDPGQQALENRLRASDLPGSQRLRAQADNLNAGLDELGGRFQNAAGPRAAQDVTESGQQIADDVARAARDARANVSALYRQARESDVALTSSEYVGDLVKRTNQTISELRRGGTRIGAETPQAAAIQKQVKRLGRIIDTGENVKPATLQQIDAMRRTLNNAIRDAAPNSTDGVILGNIKRTFDEWFDETIEAGLFSGDPASIKALRDARQARAAVGQLFENPRAPGARGVDKEVASAMQKLASPTAGEAATAGEALNAIFGAAKLGGKQSSVKVLRHLKRVFGENSPEWGTIRQAAIARLWEPARRHVKPGQGGFGRQTLAASLRDALTGPGKQLMEELFSAEEIAQLVRFRRFVNATVPLPKTTNPSGTGQDLARRFEQFAPNLALAGAGGVALGNQQGGVIDELGYAALIAAAYGRALPWSQAIRATRPGAGVRTAQDVTPPSVFAGAATGARQPQADER